MLLPINVEHGLPRLPTGHGVIEAEHEYGHCQGIPTEICLQILCIVLVDWCCAMLAFLRRK